MLDDEHLHVLLGKRGLCRTVVLDDPPLMCVLPRYLKKTKARHRSLFHALIRKAVRVAVVMFRRYVRSYSAIGLISGLKSIHK